MRATVTFRGEEREVEFCVIDEPDVNARGVDDWGFVGLTVEDHTALNITDAEDEAICEALWKVYEETPCYYEPEDDFPA